MDIALGIQRALIHTLFVSLLLLFCSVYKSFHYNTCVFRCYAVINYIDRNLAILCSARVFLLYLITPILCTYLIRM